MLGAFALLASLVFSFYFFAIAVQQIVEQDLHELLWPFFVGVAVMELLYIPSTRISNNRVLKSIPFTLFATMSTTLFLQSVFRASILSIATVHFISISITVIVALCCTVVTIQRLVQQSQPRYAKNIDLGLGTIYVLLNMSAALLYYSIKYDPKGTTKPSWTDQLG